jgi:hypothetical protein
LPNSVSYLKKQAGDTSQAVVALASECLPTGTAPITCTARRPHAHSVQHGEPDAASTTDSQDQPSPDVVENLPGVVGPTSNSGDTAEKTMHAEPSENETNSESKSSQQVVLPTETAPTTEPSAEDHSASSPSEGVYKTYEGPTCETCWTVYDCVAEAAACHPSATLTKTRSRSESVTSRTPPDLAYSQRLIDRLDTNTTTHIADMIRIVAGQPSREDALTRIRDAVFDEPERADPWSVTFLIAIELARLGCLPGYTLHESMTTIRDDCLSRSAYTADELTNPPSHVEYDNPLITTHKFDGNRYYELAPAVTGADFVPHAMDSSLPVLGTPLHYNLGVVFGSHHIAAEHDVTWIQAPHTLCATGIDAFAGFDDDDTLQVLGTVIDQELESTEQRHGSPAQSGQLHDYITHQYRRAAEVSAETVWITRNTRVAQGVLDVLADEDQIDLSQTVYESSYSIGQLQTRFVNDLQPDGLDSLHTLKQLHQQSDSSA